MADDTTALTDEEQRHYVEALERLPRLNRAVFLLSSRDKLPYAEIAWRCGVSEQDVQVRVADALINIHHYMDGRRRLAGSIRRALLPYRNEWAAARAREGDRRLSSWLPPDSRPSRRGLLDLLVWAFERVTR